jgi:hypothetical protein
MDAHRNSFVAVFQGRSIECDSLEDADALKTASDLIAVDAPPDLGPRQIDRLAEVLQRYNLHAAAYRLSHLAGRVRAMQCLLTSRVAF